MRIAKTARERPRLSNAATEEAERRRWVAYLRARRFGIFGRCTVPRASTPRTSFGRWGTEAVVGIDRADLSPLERELLVVLRSFSKGTASGKSEDEGDGDDGGGGGGDDDDDEDNEDKRVSRPDVRASSSIVPESGHRGLDSKSNQQRRGIRAARRAHFRLRRHRE